jgi:hypothetical protein
VTECRHLSESPGRAAPFYYRVQIRRPTKGVHVDEYFTTKRAADAFIRRLEHDIAEGRPVAENTRSRETFSEAVTAYLADPAALTTSKGRALKPSAAKDRQNRLQWLSRECFRADEATPPHLGDRRRQAR